MIKIIDEYAINTKDESFSLIDFIKSIPMSGSTVARRINEMSEDVTSQTIEGIKISPIGYSLQFDESVDTANKANLVCHVHFHFIFMSKLQIVSTKSSIQTFRHV